MFSYSSSVLLEYGQLRDAILVYSGEAQETAKELTDEQARQKPNITTFEIGAPTSSSASHPLSSSAYSAVPSISSSSTILAPSAATSPTTYTTTASATDVQTSHQHQVVLDSVLLLWQCVLCWCDEAVLLECGDEWRGSLRLYEQSASLVSHLLDGVSGGTRDEDVLLVCADQFEQRIRVVSRELHAGRRRSTMGSASGFSKRSSSSLLTQVSATAVH